MIKFEIAEHEWALIHNFLLSQDRLRVFDEKALRIFIEAVWYINRTGAQWRLLPPAYGKWNSVFSRFNKWSKLGVWEKLHKFLIKKANISTEIIDATINRAHACSAGYEKNGSESQGLGKSVGGHSTKINAVVTPDKVLLRMEVVPGNEHEINSAYGLVEDSKAEYFLGDKGYDCDKLIDQLQKKIQSVIPSRENRINSREYDEIKYKERREVEIFFGRLKFFRRVFSRFDKTSSNYKSFVWFASSFVFLKDLFRNQLKFSAFLI